MSTNTSEIKQLENHSKKLEISSDKRKYLLDQATDYGEQFLETLPDQPAFTETERMGEGVYDLPINNGSTDFEEILGVLEESVDSQGLNTASGKHMGYIPGGGIYPSSVADYLAAVTNRYSGVFHSTPGAVRIENSCIRWMCDLLGYPEDAAGNLTSGGSIANLIGLVAARDDSELTAANFNRAVIYTTQQVHHCVIKAINFAGLREATVRTIEMDKHYRMKSDALEKQIEKDKEEGLLPLTIFASAGTTDLGAVDPLDEIGDIANHHDLWFHVDAAYGGFFLLTDHGKKVLKGIEKSDSATIDPHKGLFLPYGSGALLVRDGQKLYDSQHMSANYMQDTYQANAEMSPADLSPELSKHFRGLRMWLPLQLFGVAPFRAALDEKLLLTRYFYDKVQQIDGIEVGPEPELSIMFFRYVPENGSANEFNKKLTQEIHNDGRVFLSSTHIGDTIYLRLAVLGFRTHLDEIEHTLDVLKELISKVKGAVPA